MIGRRFDLDLLAGVVDLDVGRRPRPSGAGARRRARRGRRTRRRPVRVLPRPGVEHARRRAQRRPPRRPPRPHHRRARVAAGRRPRAVGRGPRPPRRGGTARRHRAEGAHLRPARRGDRRGRAVVRRGRRAAPTGAGRGGPAARLPVRGAPGAAATARHGAARHGRHRGPHGCSSRPLASPRPTATSTRWRRSSAASTSRACGPATTGACTTPGWWRRWSGRWPRPDLTARDRTLLTMALAGELTYVDNARSNQLFAEARAMAEPLDDAVLSAGILLRWFWSVSGPSGVAMRASIGDQLIALDGDGSAARPAAAARPPRPGVVRPRARRRRPGPTVRGRRPGAGPPGAHADRLGPPAVRRGRARPARRRPRTGAGPRRRPAARPAAGSALHRRQQPGQHPRRRRGRVRRHRRRARPAHPAPGVAVRRADPVARGVGPQRRRPTRRGTGRAGRASTVRCPTTGCSSR